jgi:transposase-like protein
MDAIVTHTPSTDGEAVHQISGSPGVWLSGIALKQVYRPQPPDRDLLAHFSNDVSAHQFLEKIRWPDGVVCPRCGRRDRMGRLNGGTVRLGTYKCYRCRRSFSITYGTIFEASHVPLHKWLQAICLTWDGSTPIYPHLLHEILSISFKTAAAMLRRLRQAGLSSPQAPTGRQARRRPVTPADAAAGRTAASSGRNRIKKAPKRKVRPRLAANGSMTAAIV